MTIKEKFKYVVDSVRDYLKPLGFNKSGVRFYRKTENIFHIVEFQRHKRNTEQTLRFTLNIGIASSTLHTALQDIYFFNVSKVPNAADCQRRFRIGDFCEPFQDLWFYITEDSDETSVVRELLTLLGRAIPEMSKIESDKDLCDTWLETDKSQDQDSFYRLNMLATLLTCTNRTAEAEAVILRLREAFPRESHKDLLDRLQAIQREDSGLGNP